MGSIPVWVYILFVGLIYIGIKRCYTRVIAVERLVIIPLVFIIISLHGTLKLFQHDSIVWIYLLLGGFVGLLIGHFQVRYRVIQADKKNHLLRVPGDISMLVLLLIIFSIEFFIHYSIDANLPISNSHLFRIIAICLSGGIVGVSIGRNATYFYKYSKADSVTLRKTH